MKAQFMLSKNHISNSAFIAAAIFILIIIIGPFQFDDYSMISQYISETYASGTPFERGIQIGFFIFGILVMIFSFGVIKLDHQHIIAKIGLILFGIFYGLWTLLIGLFPCDPGCPFEGNLSFNQEMHNILAVMTYLIVPISFFLIQASKHEIIHKMFTRVTGLITLVFCLFLLSEPDAVFVGVVQRIIELTFLSWMVVTALRLKTFAQ